MARRDKSLKHVGAYISPQKHASLETIGEALGLSLQKTVEAALDAFMQSAGMPVAESGSPSAEEQLWIRKLLALWRSGDETRVGMLKFVLDGHAQAERAKRKQAG